MLWGKDENFYEWSSADIIFLNVGAAWKPTDKLRVDARYQLQSFRRRTDDSIVGIRRIPRAQGRVSDLAADLRARGRRVQQRLAGRSARRLAHQPADLHPAIARPAPYERAAKPYVKSFRADWLFSYQPTPGTVLFAGYGNTLANLDEDPRTARLRRTRDGFFLKLSYLFRL